MHLLGPPNNPLNAGVEMAVLAFGLSLRFLLVIMVMILLLLGMSLFALNKNLDIIASGIDAEAAMGLVARPAIPVSHARLATMRMAVCVLWFHLLGRGWPNDLVLFGASHAISTVVSAHSVNEADTYCTVP